MIVGVRLLATQKPLKRPGWKGRFLDAAKVGMWGVDASLSGEATCRNSTVISDSHLEIGHQ